MLKNLVTSFIELIIGENIFHDLALGCGLWKDAVPSDVGEE
jgi:hypothetical protein